MTAFFVTSTGTDIGKTYVGCGLLSHWRAKGRKVDAYKPLLSGFDPAQLVESDAGRLLTALGRPVDAETLDQVSPWRYAAAISADAAAAKDERRKSLGGSASKPGAAARIEPAAPKPSRATLIVR